MKRTVTTLLHLRNKECFGCESSGALPIAGELGRPAPGTPGYLRRRSVHPVFSRLYPHASGSLPPAPGMLLTPRASLACLGCDAGNHHAFSGHTALGVAQSAPPVVPELPAFLRPIQI